MYVCIVIMLSLPCVNLDLNRIEEIHVYCIFNTEPYVPLSSLYI